MTNDHELAPLHYQTDALHPEQFTWTYLERDREERRAEIRKADAQ